MIHVLGSINIDYSCQVENLPVAGETSIGNKLVLTPGGKGANQAIAARRAGADVKMTGAIGSDEVAAQAISFLQSDGVNLDNVTTVDGPTGCAFVFVDAGSENQIVVIPGANGLVTALQADDLQVGKNDVLLLQLEVPLPAVIAAATNASRQQATVIANLAPYQTLPADFFSFIDILLLNETEAQQLASDFTIEPGPNIAISIATLLKTTVVVTLGSSGVLVADQQKKSFSIAGKKIKSLDTVGAGDTFAGFLGAMIAQGKPLEECCEIANHAAAIACTRPGAQSAIPTLDELI